MSREDLVSRFNEAAGFFKFNHGGDERIHLKNFNEEVDELFEAAEDYVVNPNTETWEALNKEWADCQVTLSNLAWFFSIKADEAFRRVADNNLSKVVDGKILRREDGKILKPEGYQPVDMTGI